MVQIQIQHRSSSKKASSSSSSSAKPPVSIDFPSRHPDKVTVRELQNAIEAKFPKLERNRQRLTLASSGAVLSDSERSLGSYSVGENELLFLKDLGRQISWKTVFLIEYAGPLLIHPIFYYGGQHIYGAALRLLGEQMVPFEHSEMQRVAFMMVMGHFVKRELETHFIHRFSNSTMPFFNVFKNSAHYWFLSGVLLSVGLYGPWNSAALLPVDSSLRSSSLWLTAFTVLFVVAESMNLKAHKVLRDLRPAGSRTRAIPKGAGFGLVSCANYFWEVLSWVSLTAMTGSVCAGIFAAVSTTQMVLWALKKHRNYRKEFSDYPNSRKAIFPFVL